MEENLLIQWAGQRQLSVPTLLLQHYKAIGLDETELVAILHVQSYLEQGIGFPTPERLSERMNFTMGECAEILGQLVRRQYLLLEGKTDEQGIVYEYFSLDPLWRKLIEQLKSKDIREKEELQQFEEGQLFKRFEEEFSRPLSPFEIESISMWLDQDKYDPSLILAALREAVVSGKVNFRYIDRILLEWKRNGVKSIEQAKEHSERFRKYNKAKVQDKKEYHEGAYPGFSWLERT